MNRSERVLWVVGMAALVGALGFADRAWPGEAPEPDPLTVGVARGAVCPAIDPARGAQAVAAWHSSGTMEIQELAGTAARRAVPPGPVLQLSKPGAPVAVDLPAAGDGGAAVVTSEATGLERGLAAATCDAVGAQAWLVGAQSSATVTTELTLTNVDAAPALVDLNFFGPRGRMTAAGSRSVTVEAGESTKVALGPLVKSEEPFTVQVAASQGRVSASARVRAYTEGQQTGSGVEWLPQAVEPRTHLVLPAVPAGAGKRTLVLTNPGQRAAQVSLTRLTPGGPEVTETFASLTVAPEATLAVPVESLFKGEAGALSLEANQPVTAALTALGAESGGDLAVVGSAQPFEGRVSLPVPTKGAKATLALANPGETEARAGIRLLGSDGAPVKELEVALGAGSSQTLDLPAGPVVVVLVEVTEGQLAGGVSLSQETGPGMAGLTTLPLRGESGADDVEVDPQRRPGYGSGS